MWPKCKNLLLDDVRPGYDRGASDQILQTNGLLILILPINLMRFQKKQRMLLILILINGIVYQWVFYKIRQGKASKMCNIFKLLMHQNHVGKFCRVTQSRQASTTFSGSTHENTCSILKLQKRDTY